MKNDEKLFPFLDSIMIPKPSRQTWIGFLVACAFVVFIILATVMVVRIGS